MYKITPTLLKTSIASLAFSLSVLTPQQSVAWEKTSDLHEDIKVATKLKPNVSRGRQIYDSTCAFCHTPTANPHADIGSMKIPDALPQLVGQHSSVLIKQIQDIRNRNRHNPTMYPFTLPRYLGGAQEIADVIGYIASIPAYKNNINGDGQELTLGKELYEKNCSSCHGKKGEGSDENFIPTLYNQNYGYMLRQFIWIRDGKRRNANSNMVRQVKGLKYQEIRAVLDYASRLDGAAEAKK